MGSAAESDPKLAGSHLALAVLYMQTGNRTQALAELDLELAIAPQSSPAKALKARLVP